MITSGESGFRIPKRAFHLTEQAGSLSEPRSRHARILATRPLEIIEANLDLQARAELAEERGDW
jgi:hypothetical protein